MHARLLATALLVSAATLCACSSDNTLGLGVAGGTAGDTLSNARVRFVNATATSFDLAQAGAVSAGNGALGFGMASSCVSTNATTPDLGIRVAGTTTPVAGFAPSFQIGGRYMVIAYTDAAGMTQFATVSSAFTPASGQGGFNVFSSGASGVSYDVYITAPGASLTAPVPVAVSVLGGTSSPFVNVTTSSSQQVRVTISGSKTVVLDVGNVAFVPGQSTTLVLAPPATIGASGPRAFLVAGC